MTNVPLANDMVAKKLLEMKQGHIPICAVVTYSHTMAQLVDEAGIDLILVGDSVARVIYGWTSHAPVTLEMMVYHTLGVTSACQNAMVMADLPQKTMDEGLQSVVLGSRRLMDEGKADIVKVEGGTDSHLEQVTALHKLGIPVMAHFTPTDFPILDDPQASLPDKIKTVFKRSRQFEQAGCCAVLLAKIPAEITRAVTECIAIPTIGIGSGIFCNGQILVLEDFLGLTRRAYPYYVKKYASLDEMVISAVRSYIQEVKEHIYPDDVHSKSAAPQKGS